MTPVPKAPACTVPRSARPSSSSPTAPAPPGRFQYASMAIKPLTRWPSPPAVRCSGRPRTAPTCTMRWRDSSLHVRRSFPGREAQSVLLRAYAAHGTPCVCAQRACLVPPEDKAAAGSKAASPRLAKLPHGFYPHRCTSAGRAADPELRSLDGTTSAVLGRNIHCRPCNAVQILRHQQRQRCEHRTQDASDEKPRQLGTPRPVGQHRQQACQENQEGWIGHGRTDDALRHSPRCVRVAATPLRLPPSAGQQRLVAWPWDQTAGTVSCQPFVVA